MKLESKVEIIAGLLMLLGIGLARWVDDRWVLLAVFVGFNLVQAPITGVCAMKSVARLLGGGGGGGSRSQ